MTAPTPRQPPLQPSWRHGPRHVRGRGPRDTGTFPNLNVPQRAATVQFSDQERDGKLAALQAEQQRRAPAAGETPEETRRRLLRLAQEQQQTLRAIEGN